MHLLFPVAAAAAAAACGWPASALAVTLGARAGAASASAGPTDAAAAAASSVTGATGQARHPRLAGVLLASLILAVLAFGIASRLHPAEAAAAGCWLAACSVPMAVIDARLRRLPNVLTATCLAGLAALLTLAAAAADDWTALARAAVGALAVAAFFTLLAVVKPGSAGLGDAKLGLSTGALAAWFGWSVLLSALFAAFALAAGFGIWLIASRRASFRGGSVPFGPFLLAGCLLAVGLLAR